MSRLLTLVPFSCVEAWTYQNLERAKSICGETCGRHVELMESWEENRSLIDEVERPWACTCLGKQHNLTLAGAGFPAEKAYEAEASFHAAVAGMRRSPELVQCLRAPWDRD